jgi:hypothetical protein
MSQRAKTIQIFLPAGDPRGVRIAEITTRIVQVIEVPRSLLEDFFNMPESAKVALYFLFGAAEEEGEPSVYIGQTGDLRQRLASHNKSKDFWERALVVVSRTDSLTQTHALFLEWHCLQRAADAGRYAVENGHGGSRPYTPAPLEADCEEVFETAQVLLSSLGYPLFEPLSKREPGTGAEDEYFCTGSDSNGHGLYTADGFVVFAGSSGKRDVVAAARGTFVERSRATLLKEGVLRVDGDRVVFAKDHLFGSPSAAAVALMGRRANGWKDWRLPDGRSLDEMKRGGLGAGGDA